MSRENRMTQVRERQIKIRPVQRESEEKEGETGGNAGKDKRGNQRERRKNKRGNRRERRKR